jgi:dephospho-CoA kinase
VADIVFGDDAELSWLNGVIHPLVQERVLERARRPVHALLFCGVPLLFETGWHAWVAQVVSVWCDPQTQWDRLRARGWSGDVIRARCARQMTMDEKLLLADFGIINTGSMTLLRSQCGMVHDRLCHRLGVTSG